MTQFNILSPPRGLNMKLLPLICLSSLCVCLCVASAGAVLVQTPPSVSVTPGSKVTLSCDITKMGGQCSQVAWLRVGAASGGLGVIGVGRSVSAQSETLCLLDISSAALEQAGRYYCVYINGLMLVPGDGTTLTVTDPVLHHPVVDLLVPSDGARGNGSVPLVCLVSGLEDAARVTVHWEVNGERGGADGLLRSRNFSVIEAGVVSEQLDVPERTWECGAAVSCVLTDGELQIRRTASSQTGQSSECVFLTSAVGAVCVILLVFTVMLSMLLSLRQSRDEREADGRLEMTDEESADLHYAALRFQTSGRRNIS
ncbi:uncharacterized protein LOC116064054 [Sander lucioperca]|uniref:uncharacterized protein LOC116064054 n=1 Tax=Sander lucioperca TaxID=283035 RepID=UPI00125E6C9F|nr:uncharacterized protein LOC116064054 [Sander lucioperca]